GFDDFRFAPGDIHYTGTTRDAVGGYFDAGDDIKHIEFWPSALLATQELYLATRPEPLRQRTADDALDELIWAHRALLKMQVEDGSFYSVSKNRMRETDNIPFYQADRYVA